jgi:CMP-N,N'-diacetyllegionaminic acid synthase
LEILAVTHSSQGRQPHLTALTLTTIGIITARGGSKGIPRKNVLPVAGKPLIAWTVEAALASGRLGRVILSTDDEEIAEAGRLFGAEVPFMRPAALARDDTSSFAVMEHALDWLEQDSGLPDYILLLQPTSPLRTAADINNAITLATERHSDAVVSVSECSPHPLLARTIRKDGTLEELLKAEHCYQRRQDLPPAYVINGAIYLNQPGSLRATRSFIPRGAHAYVMPPERSIDVDTPWELSLADLLLSRKEKNEIR